METKQQLPQKEILIHHPCYKNGEIAENCFVYNKHILPNTKIFIRIKKELCVGCVSLMTSSQYSSHVVKVK